MYSRKIHYFVHFGHNVLTRTLLKAGGYFRLSDPHHPLAGQPMRLWRPNMSRARVRC